MDERVGCGDHDLDRNGNPFDYTCDDCMLPPNHYDPPEINDLKLPSYGKLKADWDGKPTLPSCPF